jgi:hypothetical protein
MQRQLLAFHDQVTKISIALSNMNEEAAAKQAELLLIAIEETSIWQAALAKECANSD